MMKRLAFSIPILILLLGRCAVSEAAWLWSPETGKWTNTKDVPKDTPEEQFFIAKGLYDEAEYKRALDELGKVIKHFPNSRWAAEAQFYKGKTFLEMDESAKAAEHFQLLVDRYPYSDRINEAIAEEFEIAESLLGGEKTKILGMAIMPAQDTAVELYRHIVKNAPYGPHGAAAQFRLADAHLSIGDFDEATQAYQAVIDEYPNSEYVDKAKFRIAKVSYKAALKHEEKTQTDEALSRFESFKTAYPGSEMEFEADDAIRELREKKAHDLYDIALFYQKRKKYKSARVYYKDVLNQFPETMMALEATTRMDVNLKRLPCPLTRHKPRVALDISYNPYPPDYAKTPVL